MQVAKPLFTSASATLGFIVVVALMLFSGRAADAPVGITSPAGLAEVGEMVHPPLLGVLGDRIVVLESTKITFESEVTGPRLALRLTPLELGDGSVLVPRANGVWHLSRVSRELKLISNVAVRQLLGEVAPAAVLAIVEVPDVRGKVRSQLARLDLTDGSVKILADGILAGRALTAAFDVARRVIAVTTHDPTTGRATLHFLTADGRPLRSHDLRTTVSATIPLSFGGDGHSVFLTEWPRDSHHPTGILEWRGEHLAALAPTLKGAVALQNGDLLALRGDFECWLVRPDRSSSCLLRAADHPARDCGSGRDLQATDDGRYFGVRLHLKTEEDGVFIVDAPGRKFHHLPPLEQLRWLRDARWTSEVPWSRTR